MCYHGEVHHQGVTRRSCVATGSVEPAAAERGKRRGHSPSSRGRSSSVGFRSSPSPPSDRSVARSVVKRSRRRLSVSSRGSATSTVFSTRSSTPSSTRTFDARFDVSSDSTAAANLLQRVEVEAAEVAGAAAADRHRHGAGTSNEASAKVDSQSAPPSDRQLSQYNVHSHRDL